MQDAPSLERKNATWRSESRWRVPRVSVSFGCNLYACGVCHQATLGLARQIGQLACTHHRPEGRRCMRQRYKTRKSK